MTFPECTMICPAGAYQIMIEITEEQADAQGKMNPGDLARWMERVTQQHLSSYGMSREGLKREGKIWVIAWNSIELLRLPKAGEKVLLRIWPCKKKGGMYPRRYAFYTAAGEPLVCAASLFVLMNSETRQLAPPTEKLESIPIVTERGEQPLPKMTVPFPEKLEQKRERIVMPEEIDKNGHLNNTHYIDWAEELAKTVCSAKEEPESIWVQYNRELLEGQKVVLKYQYTDHYLYVRGYAQEAESFSVVFKYRT